MKMLRPIALMLYRLLEGELPTATQEKQLRAWITQLEGRGTLASDIEMARLHKLLASQPRAASLRQEWSPVFRQPAAATAAQSGAFLRALTELVEDVRVLDVAAVEAGITRIAAGRPNDVRVFRPVVKHGWSIQLTTEGSGEFNCVRQRLKSQPGDLMLFAPTALYDYGRAEGVTTWTHRWVYFQAEDAWYPLLRWNEVGPGIFFLQTGAEYRQACKLFDAIQAERYAAKPMALRLAANLLEQLLIRCHRQFASTAVATLDARVERARFFIREHFCEELTVIDVARAAGLSPSRLATLFKSQLGMPVLAYRDELRLARACHMLADSTLSITQVAEAVGYADPQYFSRYFKHKMGQNPRAFRRQRLQQ